MKIFRPVSEFIIMTMLIAAVCAALTLFMRGRGNIGAASPALTEYVYIIDAGHGGMDGGAVGADGTLEKELNLAVAKKLSALLEASGSECVMTRSDDRMLVDDSVKSHRKMQDLRTRVETAEKAALTDKTPIFISIHMNNFTSRSYSGLQVWYSKNDGRGKLLADDIQKAAREYLDPENKREIKAAGSSIYVLDRIKAPAVLVECGFLSNPDECAKLRDDEYQTALAMTIFSGIASFRAGTE